VLRRRLKPDKMAGIGSAEDRKTGGPVPLWASQARADALCQPRRLGSRLGSRKPARNALTRCSATSRRESDKGSHEHVRAYRLATSAGQSGAYSGTAGIGPRRHAPQDQFEGSNLSTYARPRPLAVCPGLHFGRSQQDGTTLGQLRQTVKPRHLCATPIWATLLGRFPARPLPPTTRPIACPSPSGMPSTGRA